MAFSKNSKYLVIGSENDVISIFNNKKKRFVKVLKIIIKYGLLIRISNSGKLIALVGNGEIYILKFRTLKIIHSFKVRGIKTYKKIYFK